VLSLLIFSPLSHTMRTHLIKFESLSQAHTTFLDKTSFVFFIRKLFLIVWDFIHQTVSN